MAKKKITTPRTYIRRCPKGANEIGKLGENLATNFLIDLFNCSVENLGEKVKAFDLLCTLGVPEKPYMFLVQVKTHYRGRYTKDVPPRISTNVEQKKLDWLIDRPLPTFIAAVDYKGQKMYIAPAFDKAVKYPSVPTTHVFCESDVHATNDAAKKLLHDIKEYWDNLNIDQYKQNYKGQI